MTTRTKSSQSVPNSSANTGGQVAEHEAGPHGGEQGDQEIAVEAQNSSNQHANVERTETSGYSLASPQTHGQNHGGAQGQDPPAYSCHRTDSYVTPEYQSYQEQYTQEGQQPVWGLAAPLPHTVRSGMRPRRAADAQSVANEVPALNDQRPLREVQSNLSHRQLPTRIFSHQDPPQRSNSSNSSRPIQTGLKEWEVPKTSSSSQRGQGRGEDENTLVGDDSVPPSSTEEPPNYKPLQYSYQVTEEGGPGTPARRHKHHSRVDYLKAAASNSWHQQEASDATVAEDALEVDDRRTVDENTEVEQSTSGQVEQQISRHESYDFATDENEQKSDGTHTHTQPEASSPQRPGPAVVQEVPRPSLVDKPDVEALRKRLQSRPSFVPHQARTIARAPTETDWDASHPPQEHAPTKTEKTKTQHVNGSDAEEHQADPPKYFNSWAKFRYKLREPLSEFLAVYVMMLVGLSANLMYRINLVASPETARYGDFTSTNLCWSWATMAAIYIAGGVSGAHLSPVVTLTLCIFRGFPIKYFWKYALAQFFGCFIAALTVYGLYRDAIYLTAASADLDAYDSLIATTSVFSTSPTAGISGATAFFTQFTLVALFTIVVLALGDDQNSPPGAGMNAFIVGLFVFVIGCAFPYNTGASFNPFRDFAPRIVVTIVFPQSRSQVWTERNCYWLWGCWIGPIFGGLFGALMYDLFVFTGGESPINYTDPIGRVKGKLTYSKIDSDEFSQDSELPTSDSSNNGSFARFRRGTRRRGRGSSRDDFTKMDGLDLEKNGRFGVPMTRMSE